MRVFTYRQALAVLVGFACLGTISACGTKSTPAAKSGTKTTVTVTSVASTTATAPSTTEAASTTSSDAGSTSTTTAGGAGDGSAGQGDGKVETSPDVAWSSDASNYRDRIGTRVSYACPKGGTLDTVWGTDVYTDDSAVCVAAVHAGLITLAKGGTVVIEIGGPKDTFTGSKRNGITTQDYGSWGGSYTFPDKPKN